MILDLARWRIEFDSAATEDGYSQLRDGIACDCADCRNFMAASDVAFPASFRAIAGRLGIDLDKPAELSHCCREPSGLHLSGGWFHFVGAILSGADAWTAEGVNSWTQALEPLSKEFEFGFTVRLSLVPPPFQGQSLVQLEFMTRVPWVIQDAETT